MKDDRTFDENSSSVGWSENKHHKKILDPGAASSDKIDAYNHWAPSYDEEVNSYHLHSPKTVADLLFKYNKNQAFSLLDVGCGTGLVMEAIRDRSTIEDKKVFIVGVDFSQGMLDVGLQKKRFDQVHCADICNGIPDTKEASFDMLTCIGVFRDGHGGPELFPPMARYVKIGGFIVVTIRCMTYTSNKEQYNAMFAKANCEVIEMAEMPYVGPQSAFYAVLKRTT